MCLRREPQLCLEVGRQPVTGKEEWSVLLSPVRLVAPAAAPPQKTYLGPEDIAG